VELPDGVNQEMLKLYEDYKNGEPIEDCWEVQVENNYEPGPYYKEHPILLEECPIIQSADHNVNTIDEISSFCVIEDPTCCISFDRCESNKYFECFSLPGMDSNTLCPKEIFQWKKKA